MKILEPTGIFDISPELSQNTAVFPGDVPFSRKIGMSFEGGDSLLLSSIQTTLHLGAHADAPNHYHPQGGGIGERPLSPYIGKCQVIHIQAARGARLLPSHLEGRRIEATRVLLRTESFPNPENWNSDFNSLSPELVHFLAAQGVQLVGIDTPSVDPADSELLESHQAIYEHGLSILEGIVLSQVPEGIYFLSALPLRIKGADASPVRAILLDPRQIFT